MNDGPRPEAINVRKAAMMNNCFRKEIWTGVYGQMTLMSIDRCDDIGWEIHEDNDQMLRVEQGSAILMTEESNATECYRKELCEGDVAFIPACTWHNIVNAGKCPLKLSSVYAPPHHPVGTIQPRKENA